MKTWQFTLSMTGGEVIALHFETKAETDAGAWARFTRKFALIRSRKFKEIVYPLNSVTMIHIRDVTTEEVQS